MTKAKRMLSLLLAVIMILSVIPITASAAENDSDPSDEPSTGVNGLYMNKTVNDAHNELTLEAFVTGKSQTQIAKVPVDTALVLDTSGSMEKKEHKDILWPEAYYYNEEYFIKVGSRNSDLSELDTVYGANTNREHPVYFIRSTSSETITEMRYANGQWEYYGWSLLEGYHWKTLDKSKYGSGEHGQQPQKGRHYVHRR